MGHLIVEITQKVDQSTVDDWWLEQMMFCERSTRGPRVNTMFQVANMVDVVIHWVNGDEVKEILGSKDDLRL